MREYQQDVIDTIMKKLQQEVREIFIEMSAGTGKNIVIRHLIKMLGTEKHILMVCREKVLEQQFKQDLKDDANVVICNYYADISPIINFDYIILNSIECIPEEKYKSIYQKFKKSKIICFYDRNQRIEERGNWLDKKILIIQ